LGEGLPLSQCGFGAGGRVNRLDRRRQRFAILPTAMGTPLPAESLRADSSAISSVSAK
jgi:hypothetical protein